MILHPSPECRKDILPTEVQALVSKDVYDRYDRLLLQVRSSVYHVFGCYTLCSNACVRVPENA